MFQFRGVRFQRGAGTSGGAPRSGRSAGPGASGRGEERGLIQLVELDPELLLFGQVPVPGVEVAVELEVELTRTWAEVTAGDALAAAVVSEAMLKASPARPARATPTKSSRIAIRLIMVSLVLDIPDRLCVGDGRIRSPKSTALRWGLPHRRLTIRRELSPERTCRRSDSYLH